MEKQDALRKIQACLRLAKSSEPHEAARALAQAQRLMEKFGIEHPELLAAGVQSEQAKSRATTHPPQYEVSLAGAVAKSFDCDLLFVPGWPGMAIAGGYRFIGVGPKAEVACYTFTVLARKLKQARTAYTQTTLKRHRKNKVAAADLFCEGWVWAVKTTIINPTRSEADAHAITAWRARHLGKTGELKPRSRELSTRTSPDTHRVSGYIEGKKAKVHAGVGNERAPQLGLVA